MRIEPPATSDIPRLKELWFLGFSEPETAIENFFNTGFSPERCYIAVAEEAIAAAVYWFCTDYRGQRLAYIYALTTDPAFRGRGIAWSLMAETHRRLKETGYAGVLLYPATEVLRGFYRKMGYENACSWAEQIPIRNPSSPRQDLFPATPLVNEGDKIRLTEIGTAEFESLRDRYLPDNGVTQAGQNIAFLATYARFYKGEGFLLAAVREGDSLFGLELLGDTGAAPEILAALDCKEGCFRTPGGDIPGAMFLALEEGVQIPGYFGLTFD